MPAGIDPARTAVRIAGTGLPRARGDRPALARCCLSSGEKMRRRLPRARGDRPALKKLRLMSGVASPCPRGSTPEEPAFAWRNRGFPVPAGIDPLGWWRDEVPSRLPRARGDRPAPVAASPHLQMASPCPRGSTLRRFAGDMGVPGFPVPAGIDPTGEGLSRRSRRLPRARGDRPFPLPVGFTPNGASPCPRGSTP